MATTVNRIPDKPRRVVHSNILIIEDNWDTAETLWLTLAHEGYGARAVKSRDEALEALEHYIYDAIIMDLYMPGFGATEFLETIRRKYPRTLVYLMTAGTEAASAAQRLDLHDWIGKPFLPEDVLNALHSHDL